MIYLGLFVVFVFIVFQITGILIAAPGYKGKATDHFNGKQFINIDNVRAKGFFEVLRWMVNRKRGEWHPIQISTHGPKPWASVNREFSITFINHSTFLIQSGNINFLLDPVYSDRVSPFPWVGPKRMRPPGIRFEDLPKINYVIISHNHYDHLDIPTIRKLEQIHRPKYIVPLGVKSQFTREKITAVDELDWWDMKTLLPSVSVQAVPAQHFSGRGTIDRDKTLWCGYTLRLNSRTIYFAGDTGYNANLFKMIRERTGAIDIAIIPIGAYKPEWFMSPIHCSPREAVKIHRDVQSRQSIASHFGTFALADDSETDPIIDLQSALDESEVSREEFLALREGQSFRSE
jgi:L-ascorbate metabolism protein UlaG (beta-lactamase superfamily)